MLNLTECVKLPIKGEDLGTVISIYNKHPHSITIEYNNPYLENGKYSWKVELPSEAKQEFKVMMVKLEETTKELYCIFASDNHIIVDINT